MSVLKKTIYVPFLSIEDIREAIKDNDLFEDHIYCKAW